MHPGLVNPSVTISGDGNETISSSGVQTVVFGAAKVVTVTANTGYTVSAVAGGTCPVGVWSGVNYTTGAITANCTLSFSASLSSFTVDFVSGSSSEISMSRSIIFIGIAGDGSTFSASQGFDHAGNSYSSTCLTSPVLTYNSVSYSIGSPGAFDVFNNSTGVVLDVPNGSYSTLWMLGAGVNGNQSDQDFVFNYSTGNPVVVSQSLSDWGTGPAGYTNEYTALTCPYRDTSTGGQDSSHAFYAYAYSFALDQTRVLVSVQTPANSNVQIIALSLL